MCAAYFRHCQFYIHRLSSHIICGAVYLGTILLSSGKAVRSLYFNDATHIKFILHSVRRSAPYISGCFVRLFWLRPESQWKETAIHPQMECKNGARARARSRQSWFTFFSASTFCRAHIPFSIHVILPDALLPLIRIVLPNKHSQLPRTYRRAVQLWYCFQLKIEYIVWWKLHHLYIMWMYTPSIYNFNHLQTKWSIRWQCVRAIVWRWQIERIRPKRDIFFSILTS